jgi:molybdate transport system substrate-binding protein
MRLRNLLTLAVLALAGLVALLYAMQRRGASSSAETIVLYAAAGIKAPVDEIIAAYEAHQGTKAGGATRIEVHYAGSGDLLARLEAVGGADLFLAADESYIDLAREKGLVLESIPLAEMVPVLAVSQGEGREVASLADLARLCSEGFRLGLGEVGSAAIGKISREAFEAAGLWSEVEGRVAVMKPTVNELGVDLQIGALDGAIVWDTLARQFGLPYRELPELAARRMNVTVGVAAASGQSAAALRFARFLASPEHGAEVFSRHHFAPLPGDPWADRPDLVLFSGAINRNAIGALVESFERREGVSVSATFNGCGILTSQMKAMGDQTQASGFPDLYVACDVYYMKPVEDWFEDRVAVSGTDLVIVTAKGNPRGIAKLADLAQPGLRVILGNPTHCTIGALSDQLLRYEGLDEAVAPNVVEQTASSALLVPAVVTGAADATLAYRTDTFAEGDRLEVVAVDSAAARAVQPFGRSRQTRYPQLARRFYEHLSRGSEQYREFGFDWLIGQELEQFSVTPPSGAREN